MDDICAYSQYWPDEQKLEWFKTSFYSRFEIWVISPARAMISHPNGGMPAFVWLACAIDWVAGFWWGKSTVKKNEKGRTVKSENKKCYISFINEYFPGDKYDANELWDSLRNGLIHLYTIKNAKYALTHGHRDSHLQLQNGYVLLNVENFFDDFVFAVNQYFSAVENDEILFKKFIERFERDGFLGLIFLDS